MSFRGVVWCSEIEGYNYGWCLVLIEECYKKWIWNVKLIKSWIFVLGIKGFFEEIIIGVYNLVKMMVVGKLKIFLINVNDLVIKVGSLCMFNFKYLYKLYCNFLFVLLIFWNW